MDIDELSAWGISRQILEVVENGYSQDEETGEVFFTTQDLDDLKDALEDKMKSLVGIHEMYKSKSEALKQRSKEIAKSAAVFENKAKYIKDYINNLMVLNGKEKFDAGDRTVSYRKSTKSEIYDEIALRNYIDSSDELKEKYIKTTFEYRNKELSDAVKKGEEIPGFRLVENKNLQIK